MDVLSLVGTLANVVSGYISNKGWESTLEGYEKLGKGLTLAPSLLAEEALRKEQAGRGLPGYETLKSERKSDTITSLNEAEQFLTGGGLLDALYKFHSKEQSDLRSLAIADETARLANKEKLADFMGRKAQAETKLADTGRMIDLAEIGANQQKTADLLSYANMGAESLDPMRLISQVLGNADLSTTLAGLLAKNDTTDSNNGISGVGDKTASSTTKEEEIKKIEKVRNPFRNRSQSSTDLALDADDALAEMLSALYGIQFNGTK